MFRCRQCGAFNRVDAAGSGQAVCGRCKQDLDVSGQPQEVDADGFARATASSPVPVVVDFWAPWCPPCRAVAPALDEIARQRRGQVLVLKLNSDQAPQLLSRMGISGIPTFIAFRGGREVARQSGAMPKAALSAWVDQAARG